MTSTMREEREGLWVQKGAPDTAKREATPGLRFYEMNRSSWGKEWGKGISSSANNSNVTESRAFKKQLAEEEVGKKGRNNITKAS